MPSSNSTNSTSSQKRRTTRKTCAPCKAKTRTCSASLPCQECVAAGEATSCHYRGGLQLNALKRPNDAREPGSSRGLKATRLIAPSPSPTQYPTSPASVQASSRLLRVQDRTDDPWPQNGVTGLSSSEPTPGGWEALQQTAEPGHLSRPSPLDTLARIAQEAASQKLRSTESLAPQSSDMSPSVRGYGSTNTSPTCLRTSDLVEKTASDDPGAREQSAPVVLPFFRYFGNTAIAPGPRCVEVEVRDEQTTLMNHHHVSISDTSRSGPSEPLREHMAPVSRETATQKASSEPCTGLFDDTNPSLPSRTILARLIRVFFLTMSCHLPFLSEERIMTELEQGQLEPLEANCIAALACRFGSGLGSNSQPLGAGLETAEANWHAASNREATPNVARYIWAEPFAEKAKELIYPMFALPSLKVCQALVMITWIEWGSDRDSSAWLWSGLAIRMSQDMGLSYWDSLESISDGETRRVHRLTFWAVYFLDRVISYGAGRRVTIARADIEIDPPTSAECHGCRRDPARRDVSHPWPHLIRLLGHRGDISDQLNSRSASKPADWVGGGKEALYDFFRSLPMDVRFNVSNLRSHSLNDAAPVLVMMHCLFHSLVCVLHRPSLVQTKGDWAKGREFAEAFRSDASRFPAECASSARSISDMLSFSGLVDERTIVCNPYMDHAMFIGAIALVDELQQVMQVNGRQSQAEADASATGYVASDGLKARFAEETLREKIGVMRDALETLSRFWGGIRWVCGWLEERSQAVQPRGEAEASDSKATYQAAPTKVKADMMRFLARLRAAQRKAPLEDPASDSAGAAERACVPTAIGSPRSRLDRVMLTDAAKSARIGEAGDADEAGEACDAGDALRAVTAPVGVAQLGASQQASGDGWDSLEAILGEQGLVLDGIFDFETPWDELGDMSGMLHCG